MNRSLRLASVVVLSGIALVGGAATPACSSSDDQTVPSGDAAPDSGPALSFDEFVRAKLDEAQLPGAAVAIVKGGKVVLTRGWGKADIEKNVALTDASVMVIGSLSKTVTGAAIMTLVEAGKLDLDADINGYLPFPVRNPKHDATPITLRMLMTHVSSIQEEATKLVSLAKPGDPAVSLRGLLEPYLVPGGATYDANVSYGTQTPGEKFVYSNFAAALAALVAETVTGEDFATYCKRTIFTPLGMTGTSFRIADHDPAALAIHYTYVSGKGQLTNPQTSVPYYPSTALRTTARDLGRFLAMVARGGELDGTRVLKAETVATMVKQQVVASAPGNDITGQGLLWELRPVAGQPVAGHGGSYYGASARMHYRVSSGLGVLVLSNGDIHLRISLQKEEQMAAWNAIEERVWQEAEKL